MQTSSTVLYTAGEYEVRLVKILDTRLPPEGEEKSGVAMAYGIFHKPTGVLNGTTNLYYVAVRGAWTLDKELKQAIKDPGDEASPPPSGFGGFGQ